MGLNMTLESRSGVQHQLAHTLSRAPRTAPFGADVGYSLPGDGTTTQPHKLPQGTALDGVTLSKVGDTRKDHNNWPQAAALAFVPAMSLATLAAIAFTLKPRKLG